jgi:hypothetical protein
MDSHSMTGAAGASPSATLLLIPVTEAARNAIPDGDEIRLAQLPFKVGRESRAPGRLTTLLEIVERRLLRVPPLNDVYLLEAPSRAGFQISREHFVIDRIGSHFVLTDRKTTCGTWVNDQMVDGRSERPTVALCDGDVITLGRRDSPFRYQFLVLASAQRLAKTP